MTHARADEFASFSLYWSDEFDGPAGSPADRRIWQPETGGHGWGNAELQYYTGSTANAALDGAGNLAIVVLQADPGTSAREYGGCGYTSARLISKDRMTVRYGLVEARIQVPRALGMWSACWMLGQDIDGAGWPRCGEIDVMEHFGTGPAVIQGTAHGPGFSGDQGITGSHEVGPSLDGEFHTYAVSWEPDRIRWYIDGTLYHTVTPADLHGNPWVFDHDFYLLLNVAVGGTASRRPDSSVSFPQMMLVDYVRVYRSPSW
jgi:beta-glucanase (GH16 family)